jgi:oxygen-dependent protoporphyrinogen oxidase
MDAPVVIIGAGITGLACAHRLVSRGVEVIVLESSHHAGGKIDTVHHNGYEFEPGPNTLIANHQEMLDLIHEAGLDHDIIEATPCTKRRYVALSGKLEPIPTSPLAALKSPLLGPAAITRAALDLIPRRGSRPEDEPVADFITRRFGKRILDNLVAPFLTGIYAGDATELEARAVLKKLVAAEDSSGSVIRGMIAARKAAKRSGKPPLPFRTITFRHGLSALPHRLSELLGGRVHTGITVSAIRPSPSGCTIHTDCGTTISCARVVIATSPHAAAKLLSGIPGAEAVSAGLANIICASLAVVGLTYERSAIGHPLDGFGYLRGPGTPGPVLGCLFRSSIFPHTAPERKTLLTTFIGGRPFPGIENMTDAALADSAHTELAKRLDIRTKPEEIFIRKWVGAIPQLTRGYTALRRTVGEWSASGPISVVGSAITGLSLNDCAGAGRAEADRLFHCGLTIADCGLKENAEPAQSAIHNPQSTISPASPEDHLCPQA